MSRRSALAAGAATSIRNPPSFTGEEPLSSARATSMNGTFAGAFAESQGDSAHAFSSQSRALQETVGRMGGRTRGERNSLARGDAGSRRPSRYSARKVASSNAWVAPALNPRSHTSSRCRG